MGIHLALFGLAAMCGGYNALAWSLRREPHLAVNALAYSAIAWYEATQIRSHQEIA